MQIQDSKTMFQHIENGGSLTLNMRGQLATESAVGRFLQKIGDAIASLSSSGRAAIETRNAVLHLAMANMLRRDPVINPTLGQIPYPATPTQRNALAMYLGVAQALRKFPPEARAAARNLGLRLLLLQGLPEKGNPAEARGKALEVMNRILDDKVMCNTLRCDYARDHEELERQLGEMSVELRAAFMRQKNRNINQDGMHASYLGDALRHSVNSINGHKPNIANTEAITNEFKELIHDPKFSGFLSMVASQAGLEVQLTKQHMENGRTRDNPDIPANFDDSIEKGFMISVPHHQYDIRVENGEARIKLEMDVMLVTPRLKSVDEALGIHSAEELDALDASAALPATSEPLGGGRYTFELVVDLTQNMEGKEIPEFTLENASRKPIISPPPISIRPEGQAASAGAVNSAPGFSGT